MDVPQVRHYPSNLSEFTIGRVVYLRKSSASGMDSMIPGHVVGFSVNASDEVSIVVQFPRYNQFPRSNTVIIYDTMEVHPVNLQFTA